MASFRLATIVLLAAGVFAAYNSAFTVNQTQQALVLQLGEPKRTIQEPGLAFKLPFIQDVRARLIHCELFDRTAMDQ